MKPSKDGMPVVVYMLALATFAVGTQTYVFTGLLNELAQGLDVSVALAGQLVTAYALVSAITAPFIVNVFLGIDRRKVLLWSLTLIAIINLLTAALPNFASLLMARILLALSASVVFPIAGAIAAESVSPDSQGKALGIVLSGLTLAFILGVPLGSVVGGSFGWRSTFVFAGLTILSALPLIIRFVPSSKSETKASWSNFAIIKKPIVHVSLILSGLSFVVSYCVYAFIGPVAESLTGFTGAKIGILQAAVGFGSVIGIAVGIHLADRWKYGRSLFLLFLVLMVSQSLYSIWFLQFDTPMSTMAVPLGFTMLIASSILFALGPVIEKALVQTAPLHSSLTLAMNTSMIYLGQGLGAVFGGLTLEHLGLHHLGTVSGIIGLLCFLFLCFSYREINTLHKEP